MWLKKLGWGVYVVWECDLKKPGKWLSYFRSFINE